MTEVQKHLFEDGQRVRIKETGQVVTVDYWWFSNSGMPPGAQYNIVEIPGTWFSEDKLEKAD